MAHVTATPPSSNHTRNCGGEADYAGGETKISQFYFHLMENTNPMFYTKPIFK